MVITKNPHNDLVTAIAGNSGNTAPAFVSGAFSGTLVFWSSEGLPVTGPQPTRSQNEFALPVRALKFSDDGALLAVALGMSDSVKIGVRGTADFPPEISDDFVQIWDMRNLKPTGVQFKVPDTVQMVAFSNDKKMYAVAYGSVFSGASVRLYDNKGRILHTIENAHTSEIVAMEFSSKNANLSTFDNYGTVRSWQIAPGNLLKLAERRVDNFKRSSNDVALRDIVLGKQLSKSDDKIRRLSEMIKSDRQSSSSYIQRGNEYWELKKTELALRDYKTGMRLSPYKPQYLCQRADIYKTLGKLALAERDLTDCIRFWHLHLRPAIVVADFIAINRQVAEQRWAAQKKERAEHLYARAGIRLKRKKLAQAETDLDAAIKGGFKTPNAYWMRAVVRTRRKKYDPALADMDIAIGLKPSSARLFVERGTIRLIRNSSDPAAMVDFDKAISLAPKDLSVVERIARQLNQYNRFADAFGRIEKARVLEKSTPSKTLKLRSIIALAGLGRKQKAFRKLRRLVCAQPDLLGKLPDGKIKLWKRERDKLGSLMKKVGGIEAWRCFGSTSSIWSPPK